MEHHQPRNRIRRSSNNGYQQSVQSTPTRYPLEDDSPRTVYVSNLTNDISNDALYDAFNQYGTVESIMRRSVSFELCAGSGQQYAFVRYRAVKDARFVINLGDITVQGRKLSVRPRDKPMMSPTSSRGSKAYFANGSNRIMEMLQKGDNAQQMAPQFVVPDGGMLRHAPPPAVPHITHASSVPLEQVAQTALNNRILTVANIPADMPPMELYALFRRYGNVEGSYIFPHPDPFGRRFGQIAMATPYDAQKAYESLNGMSVAGSFPLEITNKSSIVFNMQSGAVPVAGAAGFALPQYAMSNGNGQFVQAMSVAPHHQMQPEMRWNEALAMHGHGAAVHPHIAEMLANHAQYGMMVPSFAFDHETANLATMGPPSMSHEMDSTKQPPSSRNISGTSSATLVSSNLEKNARLMAIDSLNQQIKYMMHPDQQALMQLYNLTPTKTQQFGLGKLESETDAEQQTRDGDSQVANPSSTTGPQYIPETTKPYDPANLYVKNLDDQCIINTEDLKNLFSSFGQIASAFLATYPSSGISKGFGFVAFASPQDAAKAKTALDGQVVGRKRIFITYAERKEDRIQRLKAIFEGRSVDGSVPSTPSGQAVKTNTVDIGSERKYTDDKCEQGDDKNNDGTSSEKNGPAVPANSVNNDHAGSSDCHKQQHGSDNSNNASNEMKISCGDSILMDNSGGESGQTTPSDEKDEASFSSGDAGEGFDSEESVPPFERKVTVTTTVTTTKAWSRHNSAEAEDTRTLKDQALQSHANRKEHSRHNSSDGRAGRQSQDTRYHGSDRMPSDMISQPVVMANYHGSMVGNPSIIPFTHSTQQRPGNNTNNFFEKQRRGRNWRPQNRLGNVEQRFNRGSPDREWVERNGSTGTAADINRFGFQQAGNYQHSRAFDGSKQGDNANSGPGGSGTPQRKKWKTRPVFRGNGSGQEPSVDGATANAERKPKASKRPGYSNRNSSSGLREGQPMNAQGKMGDGDVYGVQAKSVPQQAYAA